MKKFTIAALLLVIAFVAKVDVAYAISVFNSNQVGTGAVNGYVLQTTGANNQSQWVSTTTLGFTGGGASGVSSIAQTYGTAQTGAITLSTTSASFNGLTVADAITNSGGNFTITPLWSGVLGVTGGGTGSATGGTTNGVEYYNGTSLTNDNGFTYAGAGGEIAIAGNIRFSTSGDGLIFTNTANKLIVGANSASGQRQGSWETFFGTTNSTSGSTSAGGAEFVINSSVGTTQFNVLNYTGSTFNNLFTVTSNGNVGIGSTSPYSLLSVNANAIGTAPEFVVGSSTGTNLVVANSGFVGVGTSSPTAQFDSEANSNSNMILGVFRNYSAGTSAVTTFNVTNDAGSQFGLQIYSSTNNLTQPSYGGSITLGGYARLRTSTAASGLIVGTGGATPVIFITNDTEIGRFTSTGNFGLGTSSPYAQLSIGGGNLVMGAATAGGTPGDLFLPKLGAPAGSFLAVDSTGKVIATTTPSGGSGITAITGPTGLSFTGTPTSVGTLASGYSIKELPSWTVGAAGADFTTIQAALTQCGTSGGGNIYLVDPSYSQGATGLTWRGSNCSLWGRGTGTTTISFTGATTGIKTNTPASKFTHDEIHNVLFSGDGNAGDVAVDWSDMTHGIVDSVQVTGFARSIRLNDTQNITFYNSFTNIDINAGSIIGVDASSTNPVNGNYFNNIFIGSTVANFIGVQMNNANGNTLSNIYVEPGSITGTVGLKIFDNTLSTNNGVFNNNFANFYIEANSIGVSVPTTVNPTKGGIRRNTFNNMTVEANTTDWSVAAGAVSVNNFNCGYDSNFGNCLTSFAGPFGVSTSTEIAAIGQTPFSFFGVNASSTMAANAFVVDNVGAGTAYTTDLLINNSGYAAFGGTSPSARVTVTDQTPTDASNNSVFITGNTNFAKTGILLKVANNNGSDSGTTTQIQNVGTGISFEVDDQTSDLTPFVINAAGAVGIGSTTPTGTALGTNGSIFMSGLSTSATGDAVCLSSTKQLLDSGGTTCTPSARKYKTDIDYSPNFNALSEVMRLQPVTFHYKQGVGDNGAQERIGLIADDVAKIDPDLVEYDASGTVESLHYEEFDGFYAMAIQQLQKEIENGGPVRSMEENWQDVLIGLLVVYAIWNEMSKRMK